MNCGVDRGDLVHQVLVDRQPAGGVEDHDVAGLLPRGLDAAQRDVDHRRPRRSTVDRDVERLAEHLELVGRGRAVRVGRDEEGAAALPDQVPGELRGRRRLAGALEADHRDDGRIALEVERPVAGAEELHELVVDDLHDLLAGGQGLQDVGADRLLADAADEVLDDLEVDVRLEQRETDLAHRGIDVRLADAATAGQVGERLAKALAQAVEHGRKSGSVEMEDRASTRGCGSVRVVRGF
jgi:hypothetical protein